MSIASMATLLTAARARKREQWYPPERLRALRRRRLGRLIRVAMRTPYYRELFAGAGVSAVEAGDDGALARLPILEKSVLQDDTAEALLTVPAEHLFPVTTSGSTGQPLRLFRSDRDQAQVSALWARLFGAYGRRTFDRQVNIGSGRAMAKRGPVVLLRRLGALPQLHQLAASEPMERQVALIRRVRPHMISAYSIGLELLAEAVVAAGVTDIRPRVVYTSGMGLSPRCRELAREAFGVEPFDVYAANEVGPIAWECPANRGLLHLNDDAQITEIVDDAGRPLPHGTSGHVVVTQLLCTGQPLIRYRVGDLASILPERCGCGRGFRLIAPVEGRSKHLIRAPDGRMFNPITFSAALGPSPEIRRYQIRQTGPGDLRVLVIPSAQWTEASAEAIRARLVERLGEVFRYEVVTVQEIPLAPSGKFQTIVPLAT